MLWGFVAGPQDDSVTKITAVFIDLEASRTIFPDRVCIDIKYKEICAEYSYSTTYYLTYDIDKKYCTVQYCAKSKVLYLRRVRCQVLSLSLSLSQCLAAADTIFDILFFVRNLYKMHFKCIHGLHYCSLIHLVIFQLIINRLACSKQVTDAGTIICH